MKFYADGEFTLYQGDVLDCLREIADESVHCIVTSPPYWNLRDYGTGDWAGGDPACDHARPTTTFNAGFNERWGQGAGERKQERKSEGQYAHECPKCGAIRVDRQLGLEPTVEEYVASMVGVFRELRRVLRSDGTCWLNLGDSYAASRSYQVPDSKHRDVGNSAGAAIPAGLKAKDLIGVPWRVALALQADGWWLRSDIVWHKTNAMPESVYDRPVKGHEYVFLLSKSARYYYDWFGVREPAEWARWGDQTNGKYEGTATAAGWIGSRTKEELQGGRQRSEAGEYAESEFKTTEERNTRFQGSNPLDGARNMRSVWPMPTQPYPDAHFATFPEGLPEKCIRAGTSEKGCCAECGAPWKRVVKSGSGEAFDGEARDTGRPDGQERRNPRGGQNEWDSYEPPEEIGWKPGCTHSLALEPWPCTVLDPFMGSGTTAAVALRMRRHAVGIELKAEYCREHILPRTRTLQQSLFDA